MFDELTRFRVNGHFFIKPDDDLKSVCNAPFDNGEFLIYSLNRESVDMVYVGCTDITLSTRGLKDQILLREEYLKTRIREEGADALDFYWYVTRAGSKKYNPKETELGILQRHLEVMGKLPDWNR